MSLPWWDRDHILEQKKRRMNKSGSYSRMESPLSPFPSSLKLLLACLWSIWHKTTDFHSNYDMRVTRSRHFHKLPSKMPWQITQNNINDSKRVRLALFFCRRATLFCFVCLTNKMQTNCLPKTLDKFHLPFWFECYDERRRRKKNTMEIRLSRRPIWWSARNLFSFSQIYSRFGTNRWIWVFYQTYWLNHCGNWWRWKWKLNAIFMSSTLSNFMTFDYCQLSSGAASVDWPCLTAYCKQCFHL